MNIKYVKWPNCMDGAKVNIAFFYKVVKNEAISE